MSIRFVVALVLVSMAAGISRGQNAKPLAVVPDRQLSYKVAPDFFKLPAGKNFIEASAVALDSNGHIFLFQRNYPMLCEFDVHGRFMRSIGDGLFEKPHGLRIDVDNNIWTTDVGSNLVLKLSPAGHVLLVLGQKNSGAEATWLFNKPTDVAFDANRNVYITDGYGNSRVIKYNKDGIYIRSWGAFGSEPGQFDLPHAIVIDRRGRVYVADRENQRIQIFDEDGKFLKQWTGIGYPYGLAITPDQHIWMADGGYDRVIELDQDGKIVGSLGEPGHIPGRFAGAHAIAVGADRRIYVADTLNWRVQVFVPTPAIGRAATYIPTVRMFNASVPSTGWFSRQTAQPPK